jgi:hypothetical protein
MNLHISGIDFGVHYKSGEEMSGNIGLALFDKQEIWINSGHSDQTKKIALLHETIHILSSVYNMNLSEEQVVVMTHALLGALRDNPKFVKEILS